jgi:hypothetical protein
VEIRVQIVVDVVLVFGALIPSLLHPNHIGVTYARTSNFRKEPVRFMPLYYMTIPQFLITVI